MRSKLLVQKPFKIRLKKGDTVALRSGKFRGLKGKVLAVHPRLNKVTVEGINVVKKHVKPNKQHPQGGIIELTKPVWVSKVGIVDAGNPAKLTRIGYDTTKDGKKIRVYKSSGKEIK